MSLLAAVVGAVASAQAAYSMVLGLMQVARSAAGAVILEAMDAALQW
jgi:hypothetical protein